MRALRILVAAGAANQRWSYGVSGHDMPRWLPAPPSSSLQLLPHQKRSSECPNGPFRSARLSEGLHGD